MTKIYVHKDLVARLQCDSHRRRFGWLYGSIVSHSEGKHIHIKEYSHHSPKECPRGGEEAPMNNDRFDQAAEAQQQLQQEAFAFPSSTTDGILGWYIVFNYTPSDTATAQQVQEEQELMVKHTFRQMHLQLMKYLIKNNIQDEKMRKQFGMLIGLVINGRTLTEQRDEMVQVFKNQVRVYSVYTTDLYMQALFEHALKCIDTDVNHQNHKNGGSSSSEQVPVFDHALTLKRDLSLFVQSGQMSQFFRNERQMNISNDFLNSEQFISGEMYEAALSSFGGRFFDIAKVEEFCKSAMSANDDLVDQYEELYNENQRLSLQLSILNEQVRNIQRHSDIQVPQSSHSASQEMSLPLSQQVIYGESVVNQ